MDDVLSLVKIGRCTSFGRMHSRDTQYHQPRYFRQR